MGKMTNKFALEVRERAVRVVLTTSAITRHQAKR